MFRIMMLSAAGLNGFVLKRVKRDENEEDPKNNFPRPLLVSENLMFF